MPKPNYWGALLWRKLMGTTVLDPGVSIREGLHVYAHDLRGRAGGVALMVINNSRSQTTALELPLPARRYTRSAAKLESKKVELNGHTLELQPDGELPELRGENVPAGRIEFALASITFLSFEDAGNSALQR